MGLIQQEYDNSEVFITPSCKEVDDSIEIGFKCIATDATYRKRPKQSLEEIISYIRSKDKDISIMKSEQAVLGRQQWAPTPWLTERQGKERPNQSVEAILS